LSTANFAVLIVAPSIEDEAIPCTAITPVKAVRNSPSAPTATCLRRDASLEILTDSERLFNMLSTAENSTSGITNTFIIVVIKAIELKSSGWNTAEDVIPPTAARSVSNVGISACMKPTIESIALTPICIASLKLFTAIIIIRI
jgi:hypothetical protein